MAVARLLGNSSVVLQNIPRAFAELTDLAGTGHPASQQVRTCGDEGGMDIVTAQPLAHTLTYTHTRTCTKLTGEQAHIDLGTRRHPQVLTRSLIHLISG